MEESSGRSGEFFRERLKQKTVMRFDASAYFVARNTTRLFYIIASYTLLSLFEVVTVLASLGKDGGCPLQSAE